MRPVRKTLHRPALHYKEVTSTLADEVGLLIITFPPSKQLWSVRDRTREERGERCAGRLGVDIKVSHAQPSYLNAHDLLEGRPSTRDIGLL